MNDFQISEIPSRYMRAVGNFYIMHSNLSSYLKAFDGETIYLRVTPGEGWTKDPATTAIELANSWVRFNRKLASAMKYVIQLEMSNALKAPSAEQVSERPIFAYDIANRTVADLENPLQLSKEWARAKVRISGSLDVLVPAFQLAPPVGGN